MEKEKYFILSKLNVFEKTYIPYLNEILEEKFKGQNPIFEGIQFHYQQSIMKLKQKNDLTKYAINNQKFNIHLNDKEYKYEDINYYVHKQIINKIEICFFLYLTNSFLKKLKPIEQLKNILIASSKLNYILEFYDQSLVYPKNDLFGISKDQYDKNEQWINLKNIYKIIEIKNQNEIMNDIQKLEQINYLIIASIIKSQNGLINLSQYQDYKQLEIKYHDEQNIKDYSLLKIDTVLLKNLWDYHQNKNIEQIQNDLELFYAFPSGELIKKFWNASENNIVKNIKKITIEDISINQKFYIDTNFNNKFCNFKQSKYSSYIKVIDQIKNIKIKDIITQDLLIPNQNKLRIRLLHPQKYPLEEKLKKKIKFLYTEKQSILKKVKSFFKSYSSKSLLNLDKSKNDEIFNIDQYYEDHKKEIIQNYLESQIDPKFTKTFKNIIINIHGGAFIAASSSYHQQYLRLISNNLKIPIFSIDYRKAPQFKYPLGLQDCFNCYMWIKQFIEKFLDTKIEKYILFGDSSGGNFIMGLSYWILECKLPPPVFISLSYPCLRIRFKDFTPSMLQCLDELILSYGAIGIVRSFYLENTDEIQKDPYITPILMHDKILQKLPSITIYCGSEDPLFDDSLRFIEKLNNLGKQCKFFCFNGFNHGILTKSATKWYPSKIFLYNVCQDMMVYFQNLPCPYKTNNQINYYKQSFVFFN